MYAFGSGYLIGKRTDISNPTPFAMGVLQDVQMDFNRTMKELMGQYQAPVQIAVSAIKITGKATFAKINFPNTNDAFFGTSGGTGGLLGAFDEAHSVPGSSAYTVTVTQAATFEEDLGVKYASTGIYMTRVAASSEATGKYSVDEATGVYTFAVGDASAALAFSYTYTVSTGYKAAYANTLQGAPPQFSIFAQEGFVENGTSKVVAVRLNACVSSKLTMPFKQGEWSIRELDFQAFADTAGNIGTISMSE